MLLIADRYKGVNGSCYSIRLRDRIHHIRRAIPEWGRYSSWALLALIVMARLADFWGLHYGNTDDIAIDYRRMTMPFWSMAGAHAVNQARIQYFLTIPLWAGILRLAGTPWYDVLNLGSFALGALLPPFVLRKYYFPGNAWMLYAVAFFAPLPLLFSYVPPYSYPLYTSFPLVASAVAVFLFQGSQNDRGESPGTHWRLAAGAIAVFLAVCTYEPAAVLSIVILGAYFVASHSGRPWKTLLQRRDLRYAAGAIACFGVLYFGFRAVFPPKYQGVKLSTAFLSLESAPRVVGTLSLSSSVYAWFDTPQTTLNSTPLRASLSLRGAPILDIVLAFLTAAIVFAWIIRSPENGPRSSRLRLAVLALFLLFAPNAIYALVPKVASLVMTGELYAYTATPDSHIGFACAFAALALCAARIPAMSLRIFAAAILAVFAGCGSLAASGFNRESAVFARAQAARWTVIRYLAACSAQIPATNFQNLAAPGMWNGSTALLSWKEHDVINDLYWDALARTRYGLPVHLVTKPGEGPFQQLDFRLEKDGSLGSVILARSADGKRFQESWLIPARAGAAWPSGMEAVSAIVACRDGLDALHLTGGDLQLGKFFTPIEPASQ